MHLDLPRARLLARGLQFDELHVTARSDDQAVGDVGRVGQLEGHASRLLHRPHQLALQVLLDHPRRSSFS